MKETYEKDIDRIFAEGTLIDQALIRLYAKPYCNTNGPETLSLSGVTARLSGSSRKRSQR